MADSFSIPHDPEARALIVGVSITADYAISAWSNPLMWSASEAPLCKLTLQSRRTVETNVIAQTNMAGNAALLCWL